MHRFTSEYQSKCVSAQQAVQVVKSGDWVRYGYASSKPTALDIELAKRKDELFDVNVQCATCLRKLHVVEVDPSMEHFRYNTGHMSAGERRLHDDSLCYYIPSHFGQNNSWFERGYNQADVVMISVCPIDNFGYFNFGPSNTYLRTLCEMGTKVIVEVNPSMPRALGGFDEAVHITDVDMIVEDERANASPPEIRPVDASPEERRIAELIMEEIEDGSCLQLGIGGVPQTIGDLIAHSNLKDLGIHTELLNESMMTLFLKGKITGRKKTIMPGKILYTFALGSRELYEFIHDNPALASVPVWYANHPQNIMANEKAVSINNTIEVDLTGQVCSESKGSRMISGSGGQLEFAYATYYSNGGKGFIAMTSTYEKKGIRHSRILPILTPGAIVTTPRPVVHYLVTEQGKVNLKGKSEWQRAELIISVAHPDFREGLIKEAEKLGIWKKSRR